MRRLCVVILQFILISVCFCDFTENKDKFINAFVNHLNSLPDQALVYDEADLIKLQENKDNEYYIEIKVKASDQNSYSTKYQNCTGNLSNGGDGQISINGAECSEFIDSWTENMEELVTDITTIDGPIQLENEVQSENMSTSGERFIAVPRDRPAPCIGCASFVDANARGVKELAGLGIKQLDRHEPNMRHLLNNVVSVERQVQVVGGVRYIMTLAVDYDNCTSNETENCNFQKTCKVTILEKPWQRLTDGSKFRAILSNNCTEEWLFNENDLNNQNNYITNPAVDNYDSSHITTPEYGQTGASEDSVKAVHQSEVQAQPNAEKSLTDEQMKELEKQIIPVSSLNRPTDNNNYNAPSEANQNVGLTEEKVNKLGDAKPSDEFTSTQMPDTGKITSGLAQDKKKAIDELMNFFDFSGLKDKLNNEDLIRMKRDYGSELQILNLAESYQDMKTKIKNAQFIHKLAQAMVDHLNEIDIEVKNRVLLEVVSAEEEFDKDLRYFYVQARVTVSCDKLQCKDRAVKICNGIIDTTGDQPSVLYTVCNNDRKKSLGKLKDVREDDPILLKFLRRAMRKIDLESKVPYALRIRKILSASMQRVSGILTKISVEIEYTECFKTVPLFRRNNCSALENLGFRLCDIEVLERHWLKETKLTYVCTERPVDEIFISDAKNNLSTSPARLSVDDPQVLEILQEALLYLETKSNRNNKQKIVKVKSVSTQQVAGMLTNIAFTVGYTVCTSEYKDDVNTCELLDNEPLRNCSAEIWERPWLDDGRQLNVTCEIFKTKKNDLLKRKERDTLVGSPLVKEVDDPHYTSLAEESLQKHLKESVNTQHYQLIKIDKVTLQLVSGTLTKIDFHISPTNCQVNSDGEPTSTDCIVQNLNETVACHSEIWERPWLKSDSKHIEVNCNSDIEKGRKKRSIQTTDNEIEQNPDEYKNLTDDCLTNYMATYGIETHHKVIRINKVVKVNTTGDLTKIYFVAAPTNCSVNNGYPTSSPCEINDIKNTMSCHANVWIKPFLNGRIMNVNCQNDEAKVRRKRRVIGGLETQDTSNPKYKALAEKSLKKYVLRSRISQYHDVVSIETVFEQIVSGKKYKIRFMASPTNCQIDRQGKPTSHSCKVNKVDEILRCDAEIFEQSWLGKEEITVNCHPYKSREKRSLRVVGGETEQVTSDPKYMQLAKESLAKYVMTTNTTKQLKILRITKVTTQVVSGSLTRVEFDIQSQDHVLKCRSEIWEQSWIKKKDITVNCDLPKSRRRREIQLASAVRSMGRFQETNRLKSGGYHEQDPTEPKYTQMVEEALRKYQHRKKSKFLHKVIEVKRASSQVVSGKKYKIDFTAALTTCASNVTNVDLCDVANSTTLYCHAEIWDKPWLKRRDIDVFCSTDNIDDEIDSDEEDDVKSRRKRSLSNRNEEKNEDLNDKPNELITPISHLNKIHKSTKIHSPIIVPNETVSDNYFRKTKSYNTKRYLQLAEDSLREFESLSKADVLYKVIKVHYVNEDEDIGIRIRLEFTASPSNCSLAEYMNNDNCQFVEPKEIVSCHADIRFTLMLEGNFARNIEVKCEKRQKKNVNEGELFKTRHKRQLQMEEYVEDDLTYLYADNAVTRLNSEGEQNLFKLVTVHDVRRSVHMKTPIVRMYIEVAKSLCLRDEISIDLASCNEINGMMHGLCYARIWPSRFDDLVIQKIDVVCETDLQKFITLTGFSTFTSVEAALIVLNSKSNYPNFVRPMPGAPPYLIPTLDYNDPFLLSFMMIATNCSKKHAESLSRQDKLSINTCPVNYVAIPEICNAQIYMTSNSRTVKYVNVSCGQTFMKRSKRSIKIKPDNITDEDVTIQKLVQESLDQLEMISIHSYKQRVLVINKYSTKYTIRKETTIDFDVGYTNCLKYEWVDNITSCEFLEHLPRRHCVSVVSENLWYENGRQIRVDCTDDETPLEANMEYETAQSATVLSNEALKHIEYKYPNPRRQKVVRIFSLEKQMVAGIHYKIKMEVGYTKCMALSVDDNCELDPQIEARKFCRANVWIRTWTNHPPSYRVSCDYQDGATNEMYHEIQAQQLFSYFLETYKPSYLNDHEEMQHRCNIFKKNIKKIHELNVYEMGTARYAITRSADMSPEEFRANFLGLNLKLRDENQVPMLAAEIPSVSIPDAFDWREHDAVTEVKDQGMCGSCWAFSVTGNIEGQWKMHSGKLVSLSEQELVDCDKLDQGCNGGLPDNAYRAIEQLGGLETESDYPYEAEDDKCAYNASLSRVQISGAVNISSNETNMAKWLVKNGPISIGINANAMQFYVGGVSHPWRMLCNPSNLDHGVLIVGYGEKNYPLFNKKLPYWIVKNSWGKSWGEQGYYRVFRGDGTCGVNMMASSAVV